MNKEQELKNWIKRLVEIKRKVENAQGHHYYTVISQLLGYIESAEMTKLYE